MIRIFITAILYLISFFTQAQTYSNHQDSNVEIQVKNDSLEVLNVASSTTTFPTMDIDTQRNQEAKFEVIDKDLTFEIK